MAMSPAWPPGAAAVPPEKTAHWCLVDATKIAIEAAQGPVVRQQDGKPAFASSPRQAAGCTVSRGLSGGEAQAGFFHPAGGRPDLARPQSRFSWHRQDHQCAVFSGGTAAAPGGHAGDIAIAYGVTRREAKAAGKRFADHALHLAVHGVLHLAGHDHIRPKDAKVMEALEVKILARFGIADPYAIMPQ